jgi:hypothetical protein
LREPLAYAEVLRGKLTPKNRWCCGTFWEFEGGDVGLGIKMWGLCYCDEEAYVREIKDIVGTYISLKLLLNV